MSTAGTIPLREDGVARKQPRFTFHPSFEEPNAEKVYGGTPAADSDERASFMADEMTRDCTKRMHYAGWRVQGAATRQEATTWQRRYDAFRNRIVLDNQKLTYRAVQKWSALTPLADDMAGECQIVLINAVAGFNPWLGIRFSTYAFTCLMRALSRLSHRHAADRLAHSIPIDALRQGGPSCAIDEEGAAPEVARLDEYLKEGNQLLSPREKMVLSRRFHLNGNATATDTLEQVGRELGLSKERVRQVQVSALGKLRTALLAAESVS